MNWAALALAMIQLAASLLEWARRRNIMAEAQQAETVRQGLRLLDLTEQGKRIREKLASLSEDEADKLWLDMVKPRE
jgi:hypothetical protein